jgi:hypothetical protein
MMLVGSMCKQDAPIIRRLREQGAISERTHLTSTQQLTYHNSFDRMIDT